MNLSYILAPKRRKPEPEDPFITQVGSLMHFEGANNSKVFTDSVIGNVWEKHPSNNAIIKTSPAMIGSSQLLANNGIRLPVSSNSNLDLSGSANYCIELKFRPTTISVYSTLLTFSRNIFSLDMIRMIMNDSGNVLFDFVNESQPSVISGNYHPTPLTLNAINTICFQRSGLQSFQIFINGNMYNLTVSIIDYITPAFEYLYIGSDVFTWEGYQGNYAYGNIDEVRITKGVRYSGNYTPLNTPFPDPLP